MNRFFVFVVSLFLFCPVALHAGEDAAIAWIRKQGGTATRARGSVVAVDLINSKATDAGLIELASLKELRKLTLAGNKITGPALIEEHASTTVAHPDDQVEVDAFGDLVITVRRG